MLVRLVRMHFRDEGVPLFLALFEARKSRIRHFDGCAHLELWQDANDATVYYTYSYWDSEAALNHYRFSEFFKDTWGHTKALFAERAQAWSMVPKMMIE